MTDSNVRRRIAENVAAVGDRVARAAAVSGRLPDAVRLVAVAKSLGVQAVAALVEAGCFDLGESRPQELWSKAAALGHAGGTVLPPSPSMGEGRGEGEGAGSRTRSAAPSPGWPRSPSSPTRAEDGRGAACGSRQIRWHFIGHLQRNKIRRTLPFLHMIHSIDSPRLLAALEQESAGLDLRVAALVEVNVSGDQTKTGLPPDQLQPLLESAAALRRVSIRGLMGMASLEGGPAAARRDFARLRALRDRAAGNLAPGVSLDELSMGMSEDFEAAIAEGATIVRIGSALVEGIVDAT